MSLNAEFESPAAEPEFSPVGATDGASPATESVELVDPGDVTVGTDGEASPEGDAAAAAEEDGADSATEPSEEATASGIMFPRDKLANGFNHAKSLWSAGVAKVKEQADAVNANPNVVAFKQKSSEHWSVVKDKSQQGLDKVKEVTAPGVAKAREVASPVTSKVSAAAGKVGEAAAPVTQRVKEGALKTKDAVVDRTSKVRESVKSDDFQFGRKSIGSAVQRFGERTSSGISSTRESLSAATEKAKPGVERVSNEIGNATARLRGSIVGFMRTSAGSTAAAAEPATPDETAAAPAPAEPDVPAPSTPPVGPETA